MVVSLRGVASVSRRSCQQSQSQSPLAVHSTATPSGELSWFTRDDLVSRKMNIPQRRQAEPSWDPRRSHIKMYLSWKIRLGRNNHGFATSPFIKISPAPIKSLLIIGSLPADNMPVKICPARRPPGRFAGRLSAGRDFSGENDPIMGHQS